MQRFEIVVWHDENKSVWYVVDREAPDGEQPAVVRSCFSLEDAKAEVARRQSGLILTWDWIERNCRWSLCDLQVAQVKAKYPDAIPLTEETANWCADEDIHLSFFMAALRGGVEDEAAERLRAQDISYFPNRRDGEVIGRKRANVFRKVLINHLKGKEVCLDDRIC